MITETGKIVAIEADSLWVETIQQSACEACSAQKGCGQRLIAKVTGHTSRLRVLLGGRDASEFFINQNVEIGVPESVIVGGSVLVYLVPLLAMVLAVCIAPSELSAIGLGFLGLLLGGAFVRWVSWRRRNEPGYQPIVMQPVLMQPIAMQPAMMQPERAGEDLIDSV